MKQFYCEYRLIYEDGFSVSKEDMMQAETMEGAIEGRTTISENEEACGICRIDIDAIYEIVSN